LPSRPEVEILPEPIPFSLAEAPAGARRPGERIRFLTMLLLLGALLLSSCERPKENGSGGAVARPPADLAGRKIRVVATIGMITDIVSQVGGERVQVDGLMGPGVDPHLYKASEGDVTRMAGADIIFYGGLHLEGKMTEVFERMGGRILTVAVTDGIDRSLLLKPPEFKGVFDPHVWFDVTLWMKAVEQVAETLAGIDPPHGEAYRANAKAYLGKLSELHEYVKTRAKEVAPSRRVLITAHDAFNYFGRAYGFEVLGLQGISTVSEAGTADIQALAKLIVERKIPAVFVETSVSPRTIESLKEAVRARGFDVEIGGNLYSDAMGNPGTPDGTYIGMVRHNIDTIVSALSK
jgi:manganese/zinc/iron transport system substrate-binding protein